MFYQKKALEKGDRVASITTDHITLGGYFSLCKFETHLILVLLWVSLVLIWVRT